MRWCIEIQNPGFCCDTILLIIATSSLPGYRPNHRVDGGGAPGARSWGPASPWLPDGAAATHMNTDPTRAAGQSVAINILWRLGFSGRVAPRARGAAHFPGRWGSQSHHGSRLAVPGGPAPGEGPDVYVQLGRARPGAASLLLLLLFEFLFTLLLFSFKRENNVISFSFKLVLKILAIWYSVKIIFSN